MIPVFHRTSFCTRFSLLLSLLGACLVTGVRETHAQSSISGGLNAPSGATAPTVQGEQLIPAAMSVITDKQGNSWNLEQNGNLGRVGNSMVNSGLTLLLNNHQFYTYQPMMTADGKEFVLLNRPNASLRGLQVLRRIRLMEREGALRYLEVLTNGNANPITLSVALRTNFSGNYKTYLTDQGNTGVATLGSRESGVLVTPGSNQSNRAFLFSLCDPGSPLKPAITSQNKYGLTFQYNLTIGAGQTVVIAHSVAQLPTPRDFDRQALSRVFRPVSLDRLMMTIPREFRPLLINGDQGVDLTGSALLNERSPDGLGVDRGRRDILAIGQRTRLTGTASWEELRVQTQFGEAILPMESVAAVVGGNRGRRDVSRVFLRDGQVFSGRLETEGLEFGMASGGQMKLEVENLDRLVMARSETEGEWGAGILAMVDTHGGDRIAVNASTETRLQGMTPWGALDFSLDDLVWLAPVEDEPVGHYAEFRNGTRCFLFLAGDPLEGFSDVFGQCTLDSAQVSAIITRTAMERSQKEGRGGVLPENSVNDLSVSEGAPPPSLEPFLVAAGNQQIVGEIQSAGFQVLTHSETVPVSPQEVRRLFNQTAAEGREPGASGPLFRIELWGGGTLSGYLVEKDLPMQVRGKTWRIPTSDVRDLITPVPRLNEAAQQDIARLIRELGAEDWKTREKASEELASYGHLAQAILREELRTSSDPEVQRRLERILLEAP